MKLSTHGATIANNEDAVPYRKPEEALIALVTAVSDGPRSPASTCRPPEISGEPGSVAARATSERVVSDKAGGFRSNIPRSAWESSDLLARLPRIAATEDLIPCDTDSPDAPTDAAILSTLCVSNIPMIDDRNEFAISACFLARPPVRTRFL